MAGATASRRAGAAGTRSISCSLTLRPTVLAEPGGIAAGEIGDPIRLPGLIVKGKCLLPASVILVELVPHVSDLHRSMINLILRVELAVISPEATNNRHRVQLARSAADPIDGPLMLVRIKSAQREPRPALRGHVQLVHGGQAIKIAVKALDCRELFPIRAPHAGGLEATLACGPTAHEVIEVVHI